MERYKFSLKTIEVSKIEPNLDNPRGPRVRDDDDQFDYLKRSIKEFGLIVPLVVQKLKGVKKEYRLVDGERRYWALKALGIKYADTHVILDEISEDEVKNVMFHIHTNRVQWGAYQQCKALEPLYEQMKDKFKKDEKKIAIELVKLTGTNKRTINDRLNFLRWPVNIKNKVYNEKPGLYWTIAEIEEGIIKPAEKNFPEYFEKVSKDTVREYLLKKYIEGIVHASTEARKVKYIVRTTKKDKEQYHYAFKILKKLVNEVDYTFADAQEDFFAKFPEADKMMETSYKKLRNQLLKVIKILKDYDISVLLRIANDREKEEFREVLQDLEKSFGDFKRDSQDLF